jgi:hypothetical protein
MHSRWPTHLHAAQIERKQTGRHGGPISVAGQRGGASGENERCRKGETRGAGGESRGRLAPKRAQHLLGQMAGGTHALCPTPKNHPPTGHKPPNTWPRLRPSSQHPTSEEGPPKQRTITALPGTPTAPTAAAGALTKVGSDDQHCLLVLHRGALINQELNNLSRLQQAAGAAAVPWK